MLNTLYFLSFAFGTFCSSRAKKKTQGKNLLYLLVSENRRERLQAHQIQAMVSVLQRRTFLLTFNFSGLFFPYLF